ncbi:hypothetical protein SPI_06279 [Niveomyces insectorum RCEF 264]|uniref:Uncharacterized protein n=1 Tax=Niveomyces insectorum RCEF 264 TaxID=1081102 RepID=A0A167RZ32_9HYPO|nr:hypothetical protein SPI_06279 [Niveomyces insectorum RCEF 264]
MTRILVYSGALLAFAGATAMTLAANLLPTWVTYTVHPSAVGSDPFWQTIGLHRLCSSEGFVGHDGGGRTVYYTPCRPFPARSRDCGVAPAQQAFCTVWRSVGFGLAAAFVAELATLAAVAYLLDHDDRFLVPGWRLGGAWALGAASTGLTVLCGAGLVLSAYMLPPEDGYECLADPDPNSPAVPPALVD